MEEKFANKENNIGFIGCGVMGSALLQGILYHNLLRPENIYVYDIDPDKGRELIKTHRVQVLPEDTGVFQRAGLIFLAVKPQDLPRVLTGARGSVTGSHLLVSLAAGTRVSQVLSLVGQGRRVVRVMPNTPCLVGAGTAVVSPGPGVEEKELDRLAYLLGPLGDVLFLEEEMMDAVTGLSGSGPGYAFTFIEALADGGVKVGLPRETSLRLAARAVLGAARLVLETGEHPAVLRDRVTSPGGTTIAGLYALEENSFRASVMEAVEAATLRSRELGQG